MQNRFFIWNEETNQILLLGYELSLTPREREIIRAVLELDYATMEETGCPKNTVGNVIAIASIIGFIPDSFYLSMCGGWIEKMGTAAYPRIFLCCAGASALGIICAFIADRMTKKFRASK